ncbi:MAG: asparagine synthase (glutamine-hydrolyzing) [Planctomycetota bacterium]|jgi:asparagine synthase (glutamine-hydrolysing)
MCGIVGARNDWLMAQGLDPQTAMSKATAELAWRGPDGQATEHAGDWWLGCARLAISGPKSRQPVVRRGGRFVGVLNGAITNARALWRTFLPGAERRGAPPNDAWLPLLAVDGGQTDALRTLRGHHAFAVVDTKTGELTFGQDRYGEKPLHCLVARVGEYWQLVAFASTPAALHQLGMPKADNPRRLAEWFRYGWTIDRPHRFSTRLQLTSIPGRGEPFLAAADGEQWCRPATTGKPAPDKATAGLRERLITSVRRCVDSPSPSGLFLSGGIDSSCLALALGAIGEPAPAYQFRAAGTATAEREAAEAVALAARLPLRSVDGGPEVLEALPRLTQLAGQPLGDPSILAVYKVAQAAAKDGVRIMLGGEGADELLLGYRRYRALARMPRLRALRPFGSRWSMHKAARYWRATIAANPIRALLAVTPPAFANQVLAPQLSQRRCWRDAEAMPDTVNGLALSSREDDLANYLPRDLLPKVDIALMAAGIEGRCPYLEAGIEPFGLDSSKFGKRALREAFHDELPESVRRLPKVGFSLPLDAWFRSDTALLDVLADPRSRSREHLRPRGLEAAVDRHRRGTTDLGHALYLLLAYELYLRSTEDDQSLPATK